MYFQTGCRRGEVNYRVYNLKKRKNAAADIVPFEVIYLVHNLKMRRLTFLPSITVYYYTHNLKIRCSCYERKTIVCYYTHNLKTHIFNACTMGSRLLLHT